MDLIVVWYRSVLPTSFSVASIALGQLYDCHSVSKYIPKICSKQLISSKQNKTKHNKAVCLFYGSYTVYFICKLSLLHLCHWRMAFTETTFTTALAVVKMVSVNAIPPTDVHSLMDPQVSCKVQCCDQYLWEGHNILHKSQFCITNCNPPCGQANLHHMQGQYSTVSFSTVTFPPNFLIF